MDFFNIFYIAGVPRVLQGHVRVGEVDVLLVPSDDLCGFAPLDDERSRRRRIMEAALWPDGSFSSSTHRCISPLYVTK
jgi:hypothetical protein